jgi:diguanylate cyclase (GGDEF)-like protein
MNQKRIWGSMNKKNTLPHLVFSGLFLFLLFCTPPCAVAQDRASAERLTGEAVARLKSNDPTAKKKAIVLLEQAKKADKSFPFSYLYLAQIYRKDFAFESAEREYKALVQIDDSKALIHKGLGEVYMEWADNIEKKDTVEGRKKSRPYRENAEKSFKKALSLKLPDEDKKNRKELYRLAGANYIALKDYGNAVTVLGKGLEIDKNDAELHLHLARAYTGKKKFKEAEAEYSKAVDNARNNGTLAATAKKELAELGKKKESGFLLYVKIGGAVVVVVLLAVVVIMATRSRSRSPGARPERKTGRRDPQELDDNLDTTEGVCKMAIRKLSQVLQMPKGVVFLPNEEETLLVPRMHFGMDRDMENLEMSSIDVRDWVIEREGKPFVFKLERREVPFNRAFPDSTSLLGELEMRIGIPLMAQNRFLGIAYFGCKESKDKLKFKKLFETNLPLVIKISQEASDVLSEILIRKQAITDSLTGLYNETYFNEKLSPMIDEARNNGKTCSVLLVQVDGYKEIMTTFGEDHGEKLIKMSAIALNSALADTAAILCRMADTRFGVMYPELSLDTATELAEKIKAEIATVKIARHIPPATASIGLGTFPATAIYAEKLLELVQEALEKAQGEGGNTIQVAEKKLRTMETTRMTRDQVLAAVERRRQARKNMKAGGDGEKSLEDAEEPVIPDLQAAPETPWNRLPLQPPEPQESPRSAPKQKEIPLPLAEEREKPDYSRSQEEVKPRRASFPMPGGEPPPPQQPEQDDTPRLSVEKRSPFGRSVAPPQPPPPAREEPLPLEGKSRAISPFARRSNAPGQDEAPPAQGGPDRQQGVQEEQRLPLGGASRKLPAPAGPLDFSAEMKTLGARETDSRMPPPQERPPGPMPPSPPPPRPQPPPQVQPTQAPQPPQPQAAGSAPVPPGQQAPTSAPQGMAADPLTGYYQRSSFEKALLTEAQRLSKAPGECTLLYFGVDGYEQLKAHSGPTVARKVIKDMADSLKGSIDEARGVPGRIEENGFALFLPGSPLGRGQSLASRMRAAVSAFPQEGGQALTISIGIANYPHTVKSFREIILNSRKGMEKCMKSGGNAIETGTLS